MLQEVGVVVVRCIYSQIACESIYFESRRESNVESDQITKRRMGKRIESTVESTCIENRIESNRTFRHTESMI